jgi:hypothetical protein
MYAPGVLEGLTLPYLQPPNSGDSNLAPLATPTMRGCLVPGSGILSLLQPESFAFSKSRILDSTPSRQGSTVADDVILRRRTEP